MSLSAILAIWQMLRSSWWKFRQRHGTSPPRRANAHARRENCSRAKLPLRPPISGVQRHSLPAPSCQPMPIYSMLSSLFGALLGRLVE